ncbi:legumain [Biomphalaria glabrata]|nr:legumain [Biomphalaria glabrata]
MPSLLYFSLLLCFVTHVLCEQHWALLVAGSSGYDNYRHQADVCHAYHVIKSHGIPDERIIVMMYDDIAYSPYNPEKGNIINHPDGPNVYPGVPKDYTNTDLTPEVFLKVLTGDAAGVKKLLGREGKVIGSGPDDRVFVNFVDHGGVGILCFPNDVLHADELHATIKYMHTKKLYKQMVFYVEACESGSMFEKILESNLNVYVTTAANSVESSFGCYYDSHRSTYLGDVYSVMWMADSEVENLNIETLDDQFNIVRAETNTSHVSKYGQADLGKLKVADFQGNLTEGALRFIPNRRIHPTADAVSAEDIDIEILKRKLSDSNGLEQLKYRTQLESLMQQRKNIEQFYKNVVANVTDAHLYDYFVSAPLHFTSFKCYRQSIYLVQKLCPGMKLVQNQYALRKLRVLANLCESDIDEKIWSAVVKVSLQSSFCSA